MKQFSRRSIAVLLSVMMVLAIIPFGVLAASEEGTTEFAVASDPHYYPDAYIGPENGTVWIEENRAAGKQFSESRGILESTLASIKAKKAAGDDIQYLLLPGDLTRDGELEGHKELASILEAFQQETGVKVFVTPGNHDVNNSGAADFSSGAKVKVAMTSPEQFKEIYKNLGYNATDYDDYRAFTPSAGKKAGGLSYSLKLKGGYRLLAMDSAKYSADSTESGKNEHETGGNYSDELMKWILDESAKARAKGEKIVGLTHHSIVAHHKYQALVLQDFPIDKWELVYEQLADAGMHYVFTGHSHSNDVSYGVSDKGEEIYDVQSAAISSFPNDYRQVKFTTTASGEITLDFKSFAVDDVKNVVDAYGNEITGNYREHVFNFSFSGGDAATTVSGMIGGFIKGFVADIKLAGGLEKYLAANNLDLMELLGSLIDLKEGKYLEVAGVKLDVKSTVSSLIKQIDERYIQDSSKLFEIIDHLLKEITSIQLSDKPFTVLIDEMGIGNKTKGGTLGDVIISAIYYSFGGDENIYSKSSPDLFLQDVVAKFESGENAQVVVDKIIDLVLDYLLNKEVLPNLIVDLNLALPEGGIVADLIKKVLGGSKASLSKIIDTLLSMGLLDGMLGYPAKSLRDIVNGEIIDKYMTKSQMEAFGLLFSDAILSFTVDTLPRENGDRNGSYTYRGPVAVTPTVDNYQLPSTVGVTFGADTATTRNFSWYTKQTLQSGTVQIAEYSETPNFAGKLSGVNSTLTSESTQGVIPGIDLGFFTLFPYAKYLTHHTAEVTGLKPNTKYSYRVGNPELNWWGETGTIETADGSSEVSFLHLADPQAQNEEQYATWGNTVDVALKTLPKANFIVGTGDFVDQGENINQWKWMFGASDNLLNIPLMPASGNHETSGDAAIHKNFNITDAPEQDRKSGIYYSFDYNNVHVMVLNTNDLDAGGLSKAQLAWLKADAAASGAKWKVVTLHKAPYSNGSHYKDGDVLALRKQLGTLMPELGIDLVLQGHDHVYLRTDSLKDNEIVSGATKTVNFGGQEYTGKISQEGSIYVISGCAGVKTYKQVTTEKTDEYFPRAEKIVDLNTSAFSAIRIVDSTLYFDAYAVRDGKTAERIDSFALLKDVAVVPVPVKKADPKAKAEVPDTGQESVAFTLPLILLMGAGVALTRRKKEDEE